MKPKTKIQKEVARLSANLRPISTTQIEWAYRHCVEHIGYRTKKGNITCSDCGHEWHSDSGLCDTLEGCTCPKCHAELKVQDTRRRIYKETQNFSVITTCKGYQVIRVAQVRCESRKGEPMRFYCHEVVQRWISPDGKVTDMALLRGFLFCYCDVWALGSDMEVRPHNSLYDDVVARSCAYPKMRILPQLRRNGFKGDFHGISPVRLFKALLSDPRIETLMKGGEIEVMKHFLFNTRTADECWASYLIAKRHKYQIDNLSMWCDYLRMLKKLGQDLRNPKNICPEDFMAAHDNATRKIEAIHEKERAAEQRRWEIERREREQQRQLQRKKDAEDFIANKSKFFGLVITDEEIIVKVLESIDEYYNEGKTQGICVFGSGYYKKADTLILSARIGGEIISADSMQVYKHMDIGTAKIMPDEMQGVKHYLIDELEPDEEFNVTIFKQKCDRYIEEIYSHGNIPIIVGGTGFYIQAVLYDIDFTKTETDDAYRKELQKFADEHGNEALHDRLKEIDEKAAEHNVKRVIRALEYFEQTGEKISEHNDEQHQNESPFDFRYYVLRLPREILYERINKRVDIMRAAGLTEEVKKLMDMGCTKDMVSMQGIGYRQIIDALEQKCNMDEAYERIKLDTRHFAKRQFTWFNREKTVTWIDKDKFRDENELLDYCLSDMKDILLKKHSI